MNSWRRKGMNRATVIAVTICLLFTSGVVCDATGSDYDASNFSASGRKLQPAPVGHASGKDNGPGEGSHNAGEDCGICHRPGGKAASRLFTIAGTLYEDRAARRPLKGGEVILEDVNGKVISMTSNEVGNFWTYAAIGSNPCAIASHGGTTELLYTPDPGGNCIPHDPTGSDSRAWQYKAWVRNGDYVTRMVTIAPVGGATDGTSRMSCNMHHAGLGSRGGLWASGKSTLPSYPQSGLGFKRHVQPILKNKCVPCHIPGSTMTRLVTASDIASPSTSIDYSKGLDLTSYAGSTVIMNGAVLTKKGAKDFAIPYQANPDLSPLLSTPSSALVHPGGRFWSAEDPDYKAIRQWIAEGAKNN